MLVDLVVYLVRNLDATIIRQRYFGDRVLNDQIFRLNRRILNLNHRGLILTLRILKLERHLFWLRVRPFWIIPRFSLLLRGHEPLFGGGGIISVLYRKFRLLLVENYLRKIHESLELAFVMVAALQAKVKSFFLITFLERRWRVDLSKLICGIHDI